MKKIKFHFLVIILLILVSGLEGQIDNNYRANTKKALSARTIEECQSSLLFCQKVLEVIPGHPMVNYLSARLNAQLGNEKLALEHLSLATKSGYTTKIPFIKLHHLNDTAFSSIRDKKEFRDILDLLNEIEKPINKSEIAFTISDKDFLPEGIAYDPLEEMFYLGSETKKKIIKTDHSGNYVDFTHPGQTGLDLVLGIHVDPVRRVLWACSYEGDRNGIFKFDLATGRLTKKYLAPEGIRTGFNDLVIHSNGDIYISASTSSDIYKISAATDKLELFLSDISIVSPNGITLSEDEQHLYVADVRMGIHKIDIDTKEFMLLSPDSDFSAYGIDGLYCKENKLFAVQICLNRISKFTLDEKATGLESCEILERNEAYLYKPTTGVIVDDYFYFIADVGAKAYKQDAIIIMKTPIE